MLSLLNLSSKLKCYHLYFQVLNLNLGQAGSAISVADDAAVRITADSTRHGPASLVQPQTLAATDAGINGGERLRDVSATELGTESDRKEMGRRMHGQAQQQISAVTGAESDSATESETESDREEMMRRIHMRFQQTVKADKYLHSGEHTSPSHAQRDSMPAPDSQPDDLLPTTPKSVCFK
jgi:hypothetical protein